MNNMHKFSETSNSHVILSIKPGDIYIDPFHSTLVGSSLMLVTRVDNMGLRLDYTDRIISYDRYAPDDDTYLSATLINEGCTLWAGSIEGVKYPGLVTDIKFKR